MLNIINSFQNKDEYPKSLYNNSYSSNNIKINTKNQNLFPNISDNYTNINNIDDKMKNSKNNEFVIAEKTQNIQLNITIKNVDIETKIPLEIKIRNYYENKNIISIQIIDNNDPLFFYYLKIDENEYQLLKKEQSLFIEFKNFSDFIYKMLNNCLKENFNCFIIIMKNEEAFIKIEEQTQFRRLNHLTLKLNQLNNSDLKIHLGKILNEYKERCDKLLVKNKEITQNIDILRNEKNLLETNYEKLKNENKDEIEKIITEKNKEIKILNEENLKQKEELIKKYSNENNILKEEINKIKINIEDLNNTKSKLNEENLNLQKSYKDLEINYNNIQNELEEKTKNILELKGINDELNEEIYNYKKQKEELENKNQDLKNEKEKNEEINKSLKLINMKFENKLKMSIKEINKANDIIEKFQNEIKAQKTKIKSLKNEINTKTKIINEKQIIIDDLEKNINELKMHNEEKKDDIILLNKDFENQEIKEKENENIKYPTNLDNSNYEIEENQNYKIDNQAEKEPNNFNQSNSDYNPSYFFTFYKKIQNNSSSISNNKKNNIENFLKPENEKTKRSEIKYFEEKKTNENSYDNSGVYNNIYSYQFREIKGSYFNESKKRRDYFSNFPLSLNQSNQSDRINILEENK